MGAVTALFGKEAMDSQGLSPITTSSPEQDRTGSWVDGYAAIYKYPYPWLTLIFPVFGLLGIVLARNSGAALAVATGAEVVFILVYFEWKTYYVRIDVDSIAKGSFLHGKTFRLSDVDLIQHLKGDRGGQLLRIRHSDRILLTVSQDLDGFDDLVGFFREYAIRHHLIFATRDDWGAVDTGRCESRCSAG
jgi:hypothetical protein